MSLSIDWTQERYPIATPYCPNPNVRAIERDDVHGQRIPELLPRIRFQKISGLVESSHVITLLDNPQPNI